MDGMPVIQPDVSWASYCTRCNAIARVYLQAYNQLMAIDPKTWTRSYSYSGYIEPHIGRTNLKILTNAKAGKILLSKEGTEVFASGVEFYVDGKKHTVEAAREVICAAGSIQTPQILELSGIGDPAILQTYGIPVVVDNPHVGTNLQDHPFVGLTYVRPTLTSQTHQKDFPLTDPPTHRQSKTMSPPASRSCVTQPSASN